MIMFTHDVIIMYRTRELMKRLDKCIVLFRSSCSVGLLLAKKGEEVFVVHETVLTHEQSLGGDSLKEITQGIS